MINCRLNKVLPLEHEKVTRIELVEQSVECPVLKANICLWCCLHIQDQANPMTKANASERFPAYERKVPEVSLRDWASIYESCHICSQKM